MKTTVTQVANALVRSYAREGGINHLDGKNLPSKTAMASIALDLLRLLFPGFFDERTVHSSKLKEELAELVESVSGRLETEIRKALDYAATGATAQRRLRADARVLTMEFLRQVPRVRRVLRTDVEAAYTGDPAAISQDETIVAYPCIEAIAVQRLAHELYQRHVPLLPRIMTEWAHFRTGIDLHPGARLGTHFFIDHGTGTVVGETTEIGNHVKLYHGVTLGAKSTSDVEALRGRKRHPTLEDHVTIYPGATILGGETVIGAHSTIGGNVTLMQSVPSHSLVVLESVSVKVMNKLDRARA